MKKKLIMFLFSMVLLFGFITGCENVEREKYNNKNLQETLLEEGIEHDLSNYKESDSQVTIYMFRGNGCGYCKKFLTFLNSIVDEYGEYFKLESYEVWNDKKNQALMEKVASTLDVSVSGVPFIVIGDQYFTGYSERYDESIKSAIKSLYESKDRYDIFDEMDKLEKEEKKAESKEKVTIIVVNALFVIAAATVVAIINNKNTKKITEKIDSLNNEIKKLKEKPNNNKEVKETEKSKNKK